MNNGAVTLQYDGDGNRVAKIIGGTTARYLVDDLNPTRYAQVIEEVVNGTVQRVYTYGKTRISQNKLISSTWTPSFYGYDGMGSVRLLTDATGAVTDTYDYDAWGNTVNSTGSTPNVYQYSGEWLDSNLGLYYLRARYLNQTTGRFWARDPVEGKKCCGLSWNPYIYTNDNPANASDPSGRDAPEYVFQLELEIELKSPSGLEMQATQYVINKVLNKGVKFMFKNYLHCERVLRTGGITVCRVFPEAQTISFVKSFNQSTKRQPSYRHKICLGIYQTVKLTEWTSKPNKNTETNAFMTTRRLAKYVEQSR